ncbi:uncharacterized protein SCHCODRAFT_02465405, partial [Schizophyllum commune H4-8]|uniref:uncharacterized protein n=1 Tax=Schizophyllum commune (strain H4-8 / FGSC 9210) TaxID=578458 RepID=UPI002160303C
RILLVCIKSLGTCLCPRCLVEKSQVHKLGTVHDMTKRERTCRKDSIHRQAQVEIARKAIFSGGY